MGTRFRPYQPDQMLLLPQDLREWVPEGHVAHHVSDLVDAVDLGGEPEWPEADVIIGNPAVPGRQAAHR